MLAAMPAGAAASKAATAKSAKDVGGLAGLIKLAKAEGQLNVIALPRDWANYGEMIDTFSKKYGIKVNSQNPDASSADELVAVKTLKGQSRQPDVVDVNPTFAVQGANEGLWAPYKVATWNDIVCGTTTTADMLQSVTMQSA
jgi:putative spermidine/putrescine transport system substrate-binding protein